MNSKVMLFQPQVRQLQWNINTSVFSTFNQMLVTYLTQSKFFPEKNSIKYSPRAIRYFYCWPLPPQSYYYSYYYCPGKPCRKRQRRWAVNFRRGFSRTKTRMAYLSVSALEPQTQPRTQGFVCTLGIVSFFPLFQLRLCSEKTTLCLSSNLMDSSIDVSTLFAFSCMSLRLWASNALSNSNNSAQISLLLELNRIVAKSELLRHLTSMLYSRQTQLSSRARMSTLGGIFWICGKRNPQINCDNPSICLTMKLSGEFLMRSKCGANFFFRLTINLQRYSPYPAGDLLISMSLNFLERASCSSCGKRCKSTSSKYQQQASCMGIIQVFFGGLVYSSKLSMRLIFRNRQVQSRYDFWTMRLMMDRRSIGALNLMGVFLALGLQRTICVRTQVFYSIFRYYQAISRYFN